MEHYHKAHYQSNLLMEEVVALSTKGNSMVLTGVKDHHTVPIGKGDGAVSG